MANGKNKSLRNLAASDTRFHGVVKRMRRLEATQEVHPIIMRFPFGFLHAPLAFRDVTPSFEWQAIKRALPSCKLASTRFGQRANLVQRTQIVL